MAFVTEGFEVTISVADNGANVSTLTFPCNPATVTDLATAQAARDALIAAFTNVSDSVVVGNSIKEIQYNDSISYPASLVENENKASLTLQILGKNKKANLKIPAGKATLYNGTSGASANQIDVTDPALLIYVAQFHTGGVFTISDGELVSGTPNGGIVVGKRISAKNNNG